MILTVTFNPAVDQTLAFDEPMAPDRVMRATDARFDAGGKGINVAQFLTALGQDCAATGLAGGFTGQFIRERLTDDGVETAFVETDGATRLNTTAVADGTEYKLNHDGPAAGPEAVDAVVDVLRDYDPEQVVIGGSLPPGLSVDAIDAVATAGDWATVVDVEGDMLRGLGAQYALCKPNRDELAAATDGDVSTVEGCGRAADAFRARGFDAVLASLGGDGAVLATDATLLYAAAPEVAVADTVGAGDASLSGFLAARADGADDATALRTGVAAGSRLVAQAGTAPPSFDALDPDAVAVRQLQR